MITETLSSIPLGKIKKLPRFLLTRITTGQELKSACPKSIFTATEFCSWLAVKIAKQPNGKTGELLANGYANLFLVEVNGEVVLVDVDWYSGNQEWGVDAWDLVSQWGVDSQFVSRN